jgi:CxxC-x17-CxxC domain-containing protein
MLSDKKFRAKVIEKIQDPVVKAFWVTEFSSYADKFASEAVSPIQNKVGQFLSSSLIRNIVGQVKSAIDMREIMDEGKILLMNLSKGRIGEDNSSLLGAMMITKIQLAAMSRVDIPENERKDFYLYIDEFQNFSTESFTNILSEARKYRLNLIMAHQYIEQLDEKVAAAVFGNVGTLVVFRVGATDAEELVKEFTPVFLEEDIVNLPKYEFYIKLMIDGVASDPFSAKGLRPLTEEEKTGNTDKVIKVSRERYARRKEEVEEKIMRWHDNIEEKMKENAPVKSAAKIIEAPVKVINTVKPIKPEENIRDNKKNIPVNNFAPKTNLSPSAYEAICNRCGKKTSTVFKPDGIRPVYCKDCLGLLKKEKREEEENRKKAKQSELAGIKESAPQELSLDQALKSKPIDFKKNFYNKNDNKKEDFLQDGQEIKL